MKASKLTLLPTASVFWLAAHETHKRYVWVALIPLAIVGLGNTGSLVLRGFVGLLVYLAIFIVFFSVCILSAKSAWRERASEYAGLTDIEKAKVIASASGFF